MTELSFINNKTVLVTGHTGFKGSWLSKILIKNNAKVIGYSLNPPTDPNLFSLAKIEDKMISITGDIRDYQKLFDVFKKYNPEYVIHLAAQPIVRFSYRDPKYTYETNVLGTVNVLECIRNTSSVKSFLNVTTDKVYFNDEKEDHLFTEEEKLDGFDPYSNSKSCSELVTHSYKNSFFSDDRVTISTARAGNVIGGGDFAADRIIPDCIRSLNKNEDILVRNPFSVRPYQHVLEPLFLYLKLLHLQRIDPSSQGSYNVGPDKDDILCTGDLVSLFIKKSNCEIKWINAYKKGEVHEASYLKLDNSKVKEKLGWKPTWNIEKTMEEIIKFNSVFVKQPNEIDLEMDREIDEFNK